MIFAIDTGGTKTKILLANDNGDVVKTRIIKGFGLAEDPGDTAIEDLQNELHDMCGDNDLVDRIVVNLGGKNETQMYHTLRLAFKNARIDVFRESSGVIGDLIREKCGADMIFFCGTGCIVLAKCQDGCFVLDGWGRDIGDLGSGYDIGRKAIENSLIELENKAELSLLAKEITGEEKPFAISESFDVLMKKRDLVRSRILPLERSKVAAYTKVALECAKKGDKAARLLFDDAGRALGQTAIRAIAKINKNKKVTIAFCGGVAVAGEFWIHPFEETLREENIECETVFSTCDFAFGALEYAIKEGGQNDEYSV